VEELLTPAELVALERDVVRALADPSGGHIDVLGYGEISCVVAVDAAAGRFACKRLPVFDDERSLAAYARTFERYLRRLTERGVTVVPSRLQTTPAEGGGTAVYCVQPILPAGSLLPDRLARCDDEEGRRLIDAVIDATHAAIGQGVGIDAQLSNWAWVDGELQYLDVTTPLLRDDEGRSELDTGLFLAALPWLLRPLVRWLLIDEILSHYHEVRPALLDLAANLHKERLERWLPYVLRRINAEVSPAISADEAGRYYRSDAATWTLLLALRRWDRATRSCCRAASRASRLLKKSTRRHHAPLSLLNVPVRVPVRTRRRDSRLRSHNHRIPWPRATCCDRATTRKRRRDEPLEPLAARVTGAGHARRSVCGQP
jgi:hypothetical protein